MAFNQMACPCGVSSDAFTIYDDGSYHCYSCNGDNLTKQHHKELLKGRRDMTETKGMTREIDDSTPAWSPESQTKWKEAEVKSIPERNISKETAAHYKVRTSYDHMGQVKGYLFPFFEGAKLRAFKEKQLKPGRDSYAWHGNSRFPVLFGQSIFPSGGRFVTLFEGEFDSMSGYEMLRSSKLLQPVCLPLRNGANSVKQMLQSAGINDYLDSFNEIVLCFDNDSAGEQATKTFFDIFGFDKVTRVKLPTGFKDANEMLKANQADEFRRAWWSKDKPRPPTVVSFAEAWQQAKEREGVESFPYPWEALNAVTYGFRRAETTLWTAQTGRGKTQILRDIVRHVHETTEEKIAILSIEELPGASVKGLLSTFVGVPLHLPDSEYDELEVEQKAKELTEANRIFYHDGYGEQGTDVDNLIKKIRFFVKSLGCSIVILDHISMLTSEHRQDDERKALDEIATKLVKSCVDLDYALHLVAHLNRNDEVRGSANIEKLANIYINIDRDVEHEDERIRNTMSLLVRKNRFSGITGPAGWYYYDKNTCRLTETEKPMDEK